MTRRLAFVGVLLALLVSASSANSAGVSAPSPIYLRTEGLKQVGRLAESNWTERRGRYCVGQNGLGTYQFPHGLTVGAGDHRGRFRLPVADRPRKVVLRT